MFQPGALPTEFPQEEDAFGLRKPLKSKKNTLDWGHKLAVTPIVDGTFRHAKHGSKSLLFEMMAGSALSPVRCLFQGLENFMTRPVIHRCPD